MIKPISVLCILFMLYKQQYGAKWISDELPIDCRCQQWNVTGSNDIRWKTHVFTTSRRDQSRSPPSCRYAVKIEKKQCLVPATNATSDSIKKCRKLEIKEFRSFYLRKNECSKKYSNVTIQETCEDNKCQKYRRMFTPCYYRNISMKDGTKSRSLLCRVDWETCDPTLCQYKNQYWEYSVELSRNCNTSSCSDGVSRGVVRYEMSCSHVSKFRGELTGTETPCDPKTYQTSTVQKLRCSDLKSCEASTTRKPALSKTTTPNIITTNLPYDLSYSASNQPGIWPDDARYSTVKVVTTTSVIIGTWRNFLIGTVISSCLLVLIMACLTVTICRYTVCAQRKENITMHEIFRRSRDSIQRGYTKLSSYVLRRQSDPERSFRRQDNNGSAQNERVEEETVHTSLYEDDDSHTGAYWALYDEKERNIRSHYMKRSESCNSSVLSSNERSRGRKLPKLPESKSDNAVIKFEDIDLQVLSSNGRNINASRRHGDYRSDGAYLSTFLEGPPSSRKGNVKESFDSIISDISSLRRDLSFITSRTKSCHSDDVKDQCHPSSSGSFLGERSFDISDRTSSTPFSPSTSSRPVSRYGSSVSNAVSRARVSSTSPCTCHATSATLQTPVISVLHPQDRAFGMIRDGQDQPIGKIVIDTTRAKKEGRNCATTTVGSRYVSARSQKMY